MTDLNVPTKYFAQLDGLRFFALVAVTIGHWIGWDSTNALVKSVPWGHGVVLFFVLSGYLITDILIGLKEKISTQQISFSSALKNFYMRRFLRIFPPYYLLIFFLLYIDFNKINEIKIWLFTFTSNLLMCKTGKYIDEATHFWSLAVEEQFYLVWPFIILLTNKKHLLKTIICVIIISFISRLLGYIIFPNKPSILNYFTLNLFLPLSLGGILAYSKNYSEKIYRFFNNYYFLLGSVLIYILSYYFLSLVIKSDIYWFIFDEYLFSFACVFIICRASQNKFKYIPNLILSNDIVVFLGKISYGLYIYHMFMGELFWKVFAPKYTISIHNHYDIWFFYFVLLVIISIASYYIIEKPINSLKKYFSY
jgi:peptidoglycan/LPS O-acetylase OafA/YrhL